MAELPGAVAGLGRYALASRMLSLDPVTQQAAFEIQASQWRDGTLIAEERRVLTSNLYFQGEVVTPPALLSRR